MKTALTSTEDEVFQRLLKIRGLTVAVLKRALYHMKKREHICTESKCNRPAMPGIRLCERHQQYHNTWQNKRKNHDISNSSY